MAEIYQPLRLLETVMIKLDHYSPNNENSEDPPDRALFELIQDVGSYKGGSRWRKEGKIQLFDRNDSPVTLGKLKDGIPNGLVAWMRLRTNGGRDITYEERYASTLTPHPSLYCITVDRETGKEHENEVPSGDDTRKDLVFILTGAFNNSPTTK